MSLCPEHDLREEMSDDEFWEHVFSRTPEQEASWAEYDWAMNGPDIYAIECARCGQTIDLEVDEYPEERERDTFCDDCADDTLPDLEDDRL